MPHVCSKQAMMLRLYFKSNPLRAVIELFEITEVAESIYEGARALYQTKHPISDSNRASGRKTQ